MNKETNILLCDQKCLPIQKMVFEKLSPGAEVNSFTPRNNLGRHIREDSVVYINDLCYGTKYPNSFLDIWSLATKEKEKLPVIIYLHGGGFIFGDKVLGDPLAKSVGRDIDFCAEVAKRGYKVISANYAMAPEYRFPVQVEQVDQLLNFLTMHQEEYALDMENVFLGGGSAGADLAEIYGTVLTSKAYAAKLSLTPTICAEQIKGLLIDEAALVATHFNEAMNSMLGCWMGQDDLSNSEIAETLDVTNWIEDSYIPSFINTSNQEIWFEDSANALAAVLEKNGTDYEYLYRSPEFGELNHGYMQQFENNQCARKCFEHMLAFVKRHLKI